MTKKKEIVEAKSSVTSGLNSKVKPVSVRHVTRRYRYKTKQPGQLIFETGGRH